MTVVVPLTVAPFAGEVLNPFTNLPLLSGPLTRYEPTAIAGSFKTPALRNVEFTGPYLHNGGKSTLLQVLQLYDDGGDFANEELAPLIRVGGMRLIRRYLHRGLERASGNTAWVSDSVVRAYTAGTEGDLGATLRAWTAMALAREPEPLGPHLAEIRSPVLQLLGTAPHDGGPAAFGGVVGNPGSH